MNCELDVSVCNTTEGKSCANGARCVDGVGATFSCDCADGWTGDRCGDDVDECAALSPCHNGGVCVNLPGEFACSCPFGECGRGGFRHC